MAAHYETFIRAIPDFPRPGVIFRDITPMLGDADALRAVVHDLAAPFRQQHVDRVAAIEARGFVLGAPLAVELGAGFVPLRKAGKLPHETFSAQYELEYGDAAIELHQDGLRRGDNVLLVDDVLATGGTLAAAVELVRQAGADVTGIVLLIELTALNGRARLPDQNVVSLIQY
ncbi:MAG: adenine phosphoribosyltransferase [Chloroflexi bacterium]|nr:adenine phosphoribosyltransferase [Chloroflexota bacterium]